MCLTNSDSIRETSNASAMSDTITVSELSLQLPKGLGPSAFGLPAGSVPCPVLITLRLQLHPSCVPTSVSSDTMSALSVNYHSVSEVVYHLARGRDLWTTPRELGYAAAAAILDEFAGVQSLRVEIKLPKALLHAQAVIYTYEYTRSGLSSSETEISNLRVATIIGLLDHERNERQWLEFDLRMDIRTQQWDHKSFADYAQKVSRC